MRFSSPLVVPCLGIYIDLAGQKKIAADERRCFCWVMHKPQHNMNIEEHYILCLGTDSNKHINIYQHMSTYY